MNHTKILFKHIEIGQRFFDSYSGEFFRKLCYDTAEMQSSGTALDGEVDSFDSTDLVIIFD